MDTHSFRRATRSLCRSRLGPWGPGGDAGTRQSAHVSNHHCIHRGAAACRAGLGTARNTSSQVGRCCDPTPRSPRPDRACPFRLSCALTDNEGAPLRALRREACEAEAPADEEASALLGMDQLLRPQAGSLESLGKPPSCTLDSQDTATGGMGRRLWNLFINEHNLRCLLVIFFDSLP